MDQKAPTSKEVDDLAKLLHEWQWEACRIESPSKHPTTPSWDTLDGSQVRILKALAVTIIAYSRRVEDAVERRAVARIADELNSIINSATAIEKEIDLGVSKYSYAGLYVHLKDRLATTLHHLL